MFTKSITYAKQFFFTAKDPRDTMNISFIISKIKANYTLVILVSTLIRRLKWEVKRSQSKKTHTGTHYSSVLPI